MYLTTRQRRIIEEHQEKGYIRLSDFWRYYSTQASITNTINRLILLGILKDIGNQRFEFNEEMPQL